ncbi:cysteinyl-tRNA synthetase [Acinetobacter sp. TTH0-4]|uniref:SUMF1/EgtB/PvdO family nonheme iron enzyme n=1 Tax=Acinetobacter sp. TTH0-4 TaxID=1646498 RepID=UPI0006AF4D45|nr:SUMF1/EgtB/PvdO family nonheme iron enzyme [Acinetobacter sp. TTH0-4]ALD01037.1 cysteinyl-tRNA synthetase [Acinetobacter sp. TTH0-4]
MKNISLALSFSLLQVACSQHTSNPQEDVNPVIKLGNLEACKSYSGLPKGWLESETSGMVSIQGGSFNIGNNHAYPEEKSISNPQRKVDNFYIDATEVTNAQFQSFVDATGYVTEAEKQGEAALFIQPDQTVNDLGWWKLEKGISWKYPWGKQAKRKILPNEPVRLATLKDAIAYADWLGREIPTEEQWEYAAKSFTKEEDVAPVGCFEANPYGLYDMIGNVWEYTRSPFSGNHDDHMGNHAQIKTEFSNIANNYTIKGGSYLCADNYCARYRASARQSQEANLAISHVGFRTIKNKNAVNQK